MNSTFTWLDHSERDRHRMLDLIDRFRESEARDELGFGVVQNTFADMLFPGTVTFPERSRPALIGQGLDDRDLAGVVNQRATLERRLERLLEPAWKNRARLRPAPAKSRFSTSNDLSLNARERPTWHKVPDHRARESAERQFRVER